MRTKREAVAAEIGEIVAGVLVAYEMGERNQASTFENSPPEVRELLLKYADRIIKAMDAAVAS